MKKCNCGSVKIKHEVKEGRGLPPKGYKPKPTRKVSWKGTWDVYICEDCGEKYEKLRK